MPQSNYDKWRVYTKGLCSPDSYIDMGFYYLISACLQRRVWVGPEHRPLYPNQYTILCGDPGVGKGLILKEVSYFLSYFKKPKRQTYTPPPLKKGEVPRGNPKVTNITPDDFQRQAEEIEQLLSESKHHNGKDLAGDEHHNGKKKLKEPELLIPMAAESTTYEALVSSLANSYSGIVIRKPDGKCGQYLHSSLCYCLEELSSLLRKKVEDVSGLLIVAYDCGDYRKETKTQGVDRIKSCCLNFLAGTTPSFMQDVFDDRIIADGFASRTFFVFEYANRFSEIFIPELDQEQKIARLEILNHVRMLTEVYGQCTYTPEAHEYLATWWRAFPQTPRANSSLKLRAYYSRKNIHVQKLAIAIHFAETTTNFVITLAEVKKAMDMLERIELKMHYALSFKGANPLSGPSKKVLDYLRERDKASFAELFSIMWEDVQKNELEVILTAMVSMNKIKHVTEGTGATLRSWYVIGDKEKKRPNNGREPLT